MSLQAIPIFGFDQGGLNTYRKPLLLKDQEFQQLLNFYPYRDRQKKREGIEFLGRLQRSISSSLGTTSFGVTTITISDIFTSLSVTEVNAEIAPTFLSISIGSPDTATFTDNGDGSFTVTGKGIAAGSYVNYITGQVVLQLSSATGGASITATMGYFPGLPVMTIAQFEQPGINVYTTVWFDTTYAYTWNGTNFVEFIPGTTWAGTDSDFYWTTNYRGTTPSSRLFFVTNFVNNASNPMRYTNGASWTTFQPAIDSSNTLFSAQILIPYFGRLLALNTYEGTSQGSATNIFNRCRFSAVGDPTATNAWRSDIFGQGGFLDAPTNEMICSATFLNNTLIVFFEKTTWQLRYVGEYGLPFIWERIASDLGSDSTFSPVLFNDYILAVGDKALIAADTTRVDRIDLDIPNQIFEFQDQNSGVERVQGIRDYQKELVYWTYPQANESGISATSQVYPNQVLVYNYRNKKWAIFRDNITAFGTFQRTSDVLWGDTNIFWNSQTVTWSDPDTKNNFPSIVSGNQQGFVHFYGYATPDEASLSVTGISASNYGTSSQLVTLTIPNHNLMLGDIIYFYPSKFLPDGDNSVNNWTFVDGSGNPVTTDLNNRFFRVTPTDANNVTISEWNFETQGYETDFSFTPDPGTNTYLGGAQATFFPRPIVQTKDFNPNQTRGLQTKLSYIDFLMDSVDLPPQGAITAVTNSNPCQITSSNHGLKTGQKITIYGVQGMTQLNVGNFYTVTVIDANTFTINIDSTNYSTYTSGGTWTLVVAALSVQLYLNSSQSISGNLIVGNLFTRTFDAPPFYGAASEYTWQRFYATCAGQYFNVLLTYDDNLMNIFWTHQQELELHGMIIHVRPGGKLPF